MDLVRLQTLIARSRCMRRAAVIASAAAAICLALGVGVLPAHAQAADPAARPSGANAGNDGTDPTRPVRKADLGFEHIDLGGDASFDTATLAMVQPVGSGRDAISIEIPFSSAGSPDDGYGLGDIQIKWTHVAGLTRTHGWVFRAGLALDTASRESLGSGQMVFKPTVVYTRFLRGGAIFAPALGHSVSVSGNSSRSDVNSTTLDFYYVPRLGNPRVFMTVDPAYTVDWENDNQFASLAVTLGYKVRNPSGGQSQVYIKPSASLGSERPNDWGLEVGVRVLGF